MSGSKTREDIILWLNKPFDESSDYIMSDFIEELFEDILDGLDNASLSLRHDQDTLFINLIMFLYQHSNTKII